MSLPVVRVAGSAYDQGQQHGLALGEQIAHNVALYFDRLAREARLRPADARSRAQQVLGTLRAHPYAAGLDGLADSTRLPLIDLAVLNLRYELLYYQYGIVGLGGADGCSAFAVLPEAAADGHLLLGQNWDWIPDVAGAVLRCQEPDGREILSFTEAGILGGKIGLNSAGLGLTINGLMTTADDWAGAGLPFHVRCYDILRARALEEARQVVVGQARPCSANFLLAQPPRQALNLEAAPAGVCERAPASDTLAHTNHFLDPAGLGVEEPEAERRPHSYWRLNHLQGHLAAHRPLSRPHLEAALRDHTDYPDSVCRHVNELDPEAEWCVTVTSVIMDLDAQRMSLTDGPPCRNAYVELALDRSP